MLDFTSFHLRDDSKTKKFSLWQRENWKEGESWFSVFYSWVPLLLLVGAVGSTITLRDSTAACSVLLFRTIASQATALARETLASAFLEVAAGNAMIYHDTRTI